MSLSNPTKAILGLSCAALAACGGGETSTSVGTPVSSYAALSDTTRTTALDLQVAGLSTNVTSGDVSVTSGSGSLTPSSGSLTVTENGVTFTDTTGPNSSGVYEAPDGSTFVASTELDTSSYDYLDIGNLNYTIGDVTYDVAIVYGVGTQTYDMPSSATASYTGSAIAYAISSDGDSYGLSDGTSTITVSFANGGDVDVEMTSFTVVDTLGATTTAPFDTINIDNMTISDNTFSGGDITTSNGGTLVVFTGVTANDDAQGAFFAQDGIIPDEVGGVFTSDGSSGFLSGTFIGD